MFYYCLWLYHHKMDIARDRLKQKNRATEEQQKNTNNTSRRTEQQKNRGTTEEQEHKQKNKKRGEKKWKKQKT